MVAAVDSDTLYILATGVSIVSIVVAVVAKLWFGKRASDEEEDEEEEPAENEEELQEQLARGNFGRVPSEEWRLHKKALDLEYKESAMESVKEDNEKEPLLDEPTSAAASEPEVKTKAVHFQEEVEKDESDSDSDKQGPRVLSDEDLEGILNERMDEADLAHLPAQLKSVKLRKATKELEAGLTDEQKEEEVRVRNQQLESILTLMRQQEEKFGTSSMEEIEEQLKLYNL